MKNIHILGVDFEFSIDDEGLSIEIPIIKQETLEEVAERFRSKNPGTMQGGNNTKILNAFKEGAKWQQEKMYSEEDMIGAFNSGTVNQLNFTNKKPYQNAIEWFEQFKKK